MHPLQHVAAVVAGNPDDALDAKNVVATRGGQGAQIRAQTFIVVALLEHEGERTHGGVVGVRGVVEKISGHGHVVDAREGADAEDFGEVHLGV